MKVVPKAGTTVSTIGFTSNTRDMTLAGHSGITFRSAAGLMPSSFEQAMDDPTVLEMMGLFASNLFERDDVLSGLWQDARLEIFLRSWDSTAVNYGELVIFSGFLGEFKDYQLYFKAEGKGLMSKLSQDVTTVTSRACRVKQFRNSQCGHTSDTVTIGSETYGLFGIVGSVATVAEQKRVVIFTDNPVNFIPSPVGDIQPTGFFNNGTITCLEGPNIGISREILSYTYEDDRIDIVTKRPFPFAFSYFDDQFLVTAGCNRTIEDCKKYGNAINFRGEPYVPGLTTVSKVPSANES